MFKISVFKFFKILAIIVTALLTIAFLLFLIFYSKINIQYGGVKFDKDKLLTATSYVQILDAEKNNLSQASINGRPTIEYENIKPHTVNAFIAIEDQSFFNHNGLNFKRIIKSMLVNLKNGYAKEGASTISQQLIKNTHLNNDKTIERKLKEIILTKKLEKTFSKEEILEIYLNVIYFGNSCFGIEEASNFYFNKSAKNLSIAESATLAGIIKSPKLYNPLTNYENCLKRRNLVISEMQKCNYITSTQANSAISEKLILHKTGSNNALEKSIIDNACNILNTSEKELINSKLKIHTYINPKLQNIVDSIELSLLNYKNQMFDYAIIIEKNDDSSIQALRFSGYDLLNLKRQPASCLKPFMVYAPNFEDGKINLLTKVDDSYSNIGSFSPKNAGNNYRGEISVKEAISTSSNVCATKLLNCYGIEKAKNCAKKFGFEFDKTDNHLALALGSMYKGCGLITLTNAYATLARGGEYITPKLIQCVDNNNLPIYISKNEKKQAISAETAYQLTLALQECASSGTGKKLSKFSDFVACKTGTNGLKNSSENTDAFNISYSKNYTVCVWIGAKNDILLPQNINGGNHASIIASKIWEHLPKSEPFLKPENIVFKDIDKISYDKNNQILLADENSPERFRLPAIFNSKFIPKNTSKIFSSPKPTVLHAKKIEDKVLISFNCEKYYKYKLIKKCNNKIINLKDVENFTKTYEYVDSNIAKNEISEYYVILTASNNDIKTASNSVKILG